MNEEEEGKREKGKLGRRKNISDDKKERGQGLLLHLLHQQH